MTKCLVPERQIHLVNERGALGRQVSKRELPERVDVEILRAKTALRMTRTGCGDKGPITQEQPKFDLRRLRSPELSTIPLIRFAFRTAPIYN